MTDLASPGRGGPTAFGVFSWACGLLTAVLANVISVILVDPDGGAPAGSPWWAEWLWQGVPLWSMLLASLAVALLGATVGSLISPRRGIDPDHAGRLIEAAARGGGGGLVDRLAAAERAFGHLKGASAERARRLQELFAKSVELMEELGELEEDAARVYEALLGIVRASADSAESLARAVFEESLGPIIVHLAAVGELAPNTGRLGGPAWEARRSEVFWSGAEGQESPPSRLGEAQLYHLGAAISHLATLALWLAAAAAGPRKIFERIDAGEWSEDPIGEVINATLDDSWYKDHLGRCMDGFPGYQAPPPLDESPHAE